jgi:hypothetical protein
VNSLTCFEVARSIEGSASAFADVQLAFSELGGRNGERLFGGMDIGYVLDEGVAFAGVFMVETLSIAIERKVFFDVHNALR